MEERLTSVPDCTGRAMLVGACVSSTDLKITHQNSRLKITHQNSYWVSDQSCYKKDNIESFSKNSKTLEAFLAHVIF